MAGKPVSVPVELQVTDLKLSKDATNPKQFQKIEKQLAVAVRSMNKVFGQIDASRINKPIEAAMTKVQSSLTKMTAAQDKYRQAMVDAGKSSDQYKKDLEELVTVERDLAEQQRIVETMSKQKVFGTGIAAAKELKRREQAQARLNELQAKVGTLRKSTVSPEMYASQGTPEKVAKVAAAYTKVQTVVAELAKSQQQFNAAVDQNKLTDNYAELSARAETLNDKLTQLNDKSKRMSDLGATDKQWEAIQHDTQQVSDELDTILTRMREMVNDGSAFRFEGAEKDIQELNEQLTLFEAKRKHIAGAEIGGKTAGTVNARANANMGSYTADYQKELADLQKLESQASKLIEKYERMKALGKDSPEGLKAAEYDAQQLSGKLEESRQRLTELVNSGKAFRLGQGDAVGELSGINSRIDDTKSGLSNVSATSARVKEVLGKIASVSSKIGQVLGKGLAAAARGASALARGLGHVVKGLANVIKNGISATRSMSNFGKSGNRTTSDMAKGFKKLKKNMLMYVFGFRSAYYAIKRLRTIFISAFKTMATQFDDINKQLSTFVMSLNRIKGSLGTMFQPIISAILPALDILMNKLADAMEIAGKFFATLTGQGYIYKATANNYDLAESLNEAGNAAKETEKKLGAYDKLDVIQSNDNDSNKGNGSNNLLDVTYGKASAEGAASDFAKLIKESWEKADFTEVGEVIGEKIIGLLDTVKTKVLPKLTGLINKLTNSAVTFLEGLDLTSIGSKVADLFNDLLSNIDFTKVGQTLASVKSAFWQFLNGILNDLDWEGVGTAIANFVTGWVDKIDINALVGAITGLISGLGNALVTFVDSINWAEVGDKFGEGIKKFIEDIDMNKVAEGLGKLISGIGTALLNLIQNIDFEKAATKFAKSLNKFLGNIDGSDFASGLGSLLGGIVTFFGTLIAKIDWSKIYKELVDGIDKMLAKVEESLKNSNSPGFQAIGDLVGAIREVIQTLAPVIQQLVEALGPIVNAILPVISTILPPIADIIAQFVDLILPLFIGLIETLMPFIENLVMAILPVFQELLTALQPFFEVLVNDILPILGELLDAIMPVIEGILSAVTAILTPIAKLLAPLLKLVSKILEPIVKLLQPIFKLVGSLFDALGKILGPILDLISPLLEILTELLEPIFEVLGVIFDLLSPFIEIIKVVVDVISNLLGGALNVLVGIFDVVKNALQKLGEAFKSVFNGIKNVFQTVWNVIKGIINGIIGGIEGMVNGIIKGINLLIQGLNKIRWDVPDWVPVIGGKTLGFNIRELTEVRIPRLAQGAVIPPNKQFLAMLGDQSSGTNIEAPLDTIKQALSEVLSGFGNTTHDPIVLTLDGRTIAKVVWEESEKRYKQTGKIGVY